jgi:hypothetical protein
MRKHVVFVLLVAFFSGRAKATILSGSVSFDPTTNLTGLGVLSAKRSQLRPSAA